MNILIKKPTLDNIPASQIITDRWFSFGDSSARIHVCIGQHIYAVTKNGLECLTHTEPIYKHYYTNVRYLEIEELIMF